MKIGIISQYYPASYRPGFDTEFAQFVRDGHEIAIYSGSAMGAADPETIARYHLDDLTRHYPNSVRDVPKYGPRVLSALMQRPGVAGRAASLARRLKGATVRRRIT